MVDESSAINDKKKVYVGCSLTHASEEFAANVIALKERLRDEGYEVFEFVGLVDGTPLDVYEWDIGHCVADCDVFIAVCDEASIGVGWELSAALALKKTCLAVAHTDARVTRLLLGAAEAEDNLHFERYENLAKDVPVMLQRLEVAENQKVSR